MGNLGLEVLRQKSTDEDKHWQTLDDNPDLKAFLTNSKNGTNSDLEARTLRI